MDRSVVAVETGRPVPILDAHRGEGILHEAVSVQLVRADGAWLLQRRAPGKALFAGCWANSCCTHPRPGESAADAAARRVGEELGVTLTSPLVEAGDFTYRAVDPVSGLVEHEHDRVFVGRFDGDVAPHPAEIGDLWFGPQDQVIEALARQPAPWAPSVLELAALRYLAGRA